MDTNKNPIINQTFSLKMSESDFKTLSNYINNELGIKMPVEKKVMLESRLQKRLKELSIGSFSDYCDFVFSKKGQEEEIYHMIDVVTTNKTDFFREPAHFEFLESYVIPNYANENKGKTINIWSAGCSSGEEPYTLAIVLSEMMEQYPYFDFKIFASDISIRMLEKAAMAIYHESRVADVPLALKKKYLLKSKDPLNKTVRFIPQIRSRLSFGRINFMDEYYDLNTTFDIVFCRNVLIYFDRATQESVINKLCRKLAPGGFFFLGHSESITNMNVPLQNIKPTIFKRI